MLRRICGLLLLAAVMAPVGASAQEPAKSSATVAVADSGYQLGVSDKIHITVYNEPNLTGDFPINPNGNISIPLIGDVKAVGNTASALRDEIQRRLADGYLRDPKVAVDIVSFRPFYILGEVTHAGEFPYSDGLTVLNAVATAQGFTYRANKKYVFVKRKGEIKETRVRLTPDLRVEPGDTIRIGERYF